jgi:hypothetical protein
MTFSVKDWKGIKNAPLLPISSVEPNSPSYIRYSFGTLYIVVAISFRILYTHDAPVKHTPQEHPCEAPILALEP